MATITVRKLDANGDPLWGSGTANFISDLDAVTQIIRTRLLLFQGQWWERLQEGLPVFQRMLGHSNSSRVTSLLIQQRILGAPYVLSISDVAVQQDKTKRSFSFSCTAHTQFGSTTVVWTPGLAAQITH